MDHIKHELKRGERARLGLWLYDEAPRIGSGWRVVDIHVGNRGVTLKCPHTKRVARIPRALFNSIVNRERVA